jgi:hypothetical protein
MHGLQPLKPYQQAIAQAVRESVLHNRGLTFTVEIAHHGGAWAISAHLELFLLCAHALSRIRHLKIIPEPSSQAAERLAQLLDSRQIFLDPTMPDRISRSVGCSFSLKSYAGTP